MAYAHSAYYYKAEASDTVIVFVHGIQGSPQQFDFMIKALNKAYSIENLLLPGHGQTVKAFRRSSMLQWQQFLDGEVRKLQEDYKNIILVGHSMGCLLAVQSAISCPQRIRGLFLLAMPLNFHIRYSYIRNNLIVAFSKSEKSEVIAAARRGNSVSASQPFAYLTCIPRYAELLKKSKATRRLVEELTLPAVLVHLANDEIVSPKTLWHAVNRPNIQAVTVNHAGHYYFAQEAQVQICDLLKEFITKTNAEL